jgi:hypothetical protein
LNWLIIKVTENSIVVLKILLPKGGSITRASIREYTEAVRWRYLRVPKEEKGKILDEFTSVTGYQLKAAIRLLHLVNKTSTGKKRRRSRQYVVTVIGALRTAW